MENSVTGDCRVSAECENLLHSFQNLYVNNQIQQGENQAPVPVPLYSESMWAVQRLSGSENFGSSNLQYETISSSDFHSPNSNPNGSLQANPFHRSDFHLADYRDILLLAQDQEGSQYLQEKLSSEDSGITCNTFWAIYRFPFEFMNHQNGRFVFGKFIELCNTDQLKMITFRITSKDSEPLFLDISAQRFGSSSIKKLIKALAKTTFISSVMSILNRLFKPMMMNKFGSSIILQCLEHQRSRENDLIYQAALEHCLTLACHEQGCIYLNNFIDEMNGARRKQVLHLISVNAANLSGNSFGNYVVQHVLKLENPELIVKICLALTGNCVDLSMKKGGSFVVQKCLKYQTMLPYIVEEFLNSNQIFQVANDRYGNYVIQTALEETMKVNRFYLHQRLVMELQPHLPVLRFGYGKHVYKLVTEEMDLISGLLASDLEIC